MIEDRCFFISDRAFYADMTSLVVHDERNSRARRHAIGLARLLKVWLAALLEEPRSGGSR